MKSRAVVFGLVAGLCWVALSAWRVQPVRGASAGAPAGAQAANSLGIASASAVAPDASPAPERWDRAAAARYLDAREVWWQAWPKAQRDHGTICISCHTVVPYALARPGLSRTLGDAEMPAPEKVMWGNVETRVNRWPEMLPFYSDAVHGPGKTETSHATEAVLNAVLLARYDAGAGADTGSQGPGHLRPVTRKALDAAWALQEQTGELAGGWKWQDFHLGPWEADESGYQGAAMLLMAVGAAPDGYAREAAVRPHVDRLKQFLKRSYAAQPGMNQLYVLWAASYVPGLLTGDERRHLLETVRGLEQEDGGWRLAALDARERADHTLQPTASDGYATGLAVLVMAESGISGTDATLRRGVEWLERHQEKDGRWPAASLNKERNPESAPALFMSDAATGYAVLALERVR